MSAIPPRAWPWRVPPEDTENLYPNLVVSDNRVSGSITLGPSRLPLWAFVPRLPYSSWANVIYSFPQITGYGWTDGQCAAFLAYLLEQRGEFGRLLLVLADVERQEEALRQRETDDGLTCWWDMPAQRERVSEQLRRCLAALEAPERTETNDAPLRT